ncbi:MAG: nucleoid-associated protein [Flavisolibacter sp.]
MITAFDATIDSLSIHYIGNKAKDELCVFSEAPLFLLDEHLPTLVLDYFIKPFEKMEENFHFSHAAAIELNEVFHYSKEIFQNTIDFHQASIGIAKHLYNISSHPNIKPGELYVARFKNILVDGIESEAIGIFKSEIKEPYLTVQRDGSFFQLQYELNAINIKKLDKGCLIFNTEEESGYKVMVIDQTNKNNEALYWVDLFLQLKVRNDEFNQTNSILTVYKNFISEEVDKEIELTKPEKIDLLNRSIKYFKEKEQFNLDEFSTEVIGHDHGIKLFKQYKDDYEQRYETDIQDEFTISGSAVKKQARIYKSVLKLDRNFHIYIHSNSELIERGVDNDGRKYYKIYYEEEL